MRTHRLVQTSLALGGALLALAVACGPAAEPTATTGAAPTATTARTAPTATTATTAPKSTATTARTAPTATTAMTVGKTPSAGETKIRPYPILTKPPIDPNAKKGGTFVFASESVPPDFSVWESAVGTTIDDMAPAHDTLMEVNSYEEGKGDQILPNVAYDWWTDKTGTEWTFLLTKGVKFHNGEELTCADVAFMVKTMRDSQDDTGDQLRFSPREAYIHRVTGVTCPDAYTVKMKTDGPMNSLVASLSSINFVLLPKSVFEGNLDAMRTEIGPSAGAFTWDKGTYRPDSLLAFNRNPNYWNQPFPYLDRVEFQFLGSRTAVQAAFRVGRIDAMSDQSITRQMEEEMSKSGRAIIYPLQATDGYTSWETNYQRQPWSDPRFMRAIRCTLDSGKAIATGWDGEGFEVPVFPLKELPGGTDWAMTKKEWMAIDPCQGPSSETDMTQRIKIAQDLMKEMGFGPNNVAKPYMPLQQGFSTTGWPSVQQDLVKIWLEPQTETVTYAQSVAKVNAGEFDVYSHGYITNRMDPDQWFYEQVYSTSSRNYGKYTNPEMDALIDAMSREQDVAKRKEQVDQLSTMWLKNNVKIFIRYTAYSSVNVPWVRNYNFTLPSNQQNRFKNIRTWIDPEVKAKILGQ